MIRLTPERARALKIVLLVMVAVVAAPVTLALMFARAGEVRR